MLTVKDLIARVRNSIHDEQEAEFTDAVLLGFINDGVSILRRTIMTLNPMLLNENIIGTLQPEADTIIFDKPVSRLVNVTMDKKQLRITSKPDIANYELTGVPECCYLLGVQTVKLFPVDFQTHSYSIDYIPDMVLLTIDGVSPFLTDIDIVLIEYVVVRASLTDEFDMSAETSVLSTVMAQAEQLIRDLAPMEVQTNGYWDNCLCRQRAWNHNHMYR